MELLEQAVGDHLPKAWRTSNSVDDVDVDGDVDVAHRCTIFLCHLDL